MCQHTRVVVWLLRAAVLLGVLQGAAVLARGSPRGLLQEPTAGQAPTAVTQAGCDCPSSWNYTFDANRTVQLSGCSNPDNDPQGTWCPIDPNTCRSFTGVSENGGKAYAYDYCTQVRETTKSGCLCRPYWFGFRAFEDVGTKEYEGVCASPDGAAKPYCFVDPATCRGAVPNNEKSTCDRPKVPVDGAVGRKETASGCKCISFKLATGAEGPFKVINSCSNPDDDPKGSWCVVNRTSCPTFYSSFTQDFRSVFYDYCTPVRATTNAGCRCRTVWGPGTKYRDQCANPDGKPASWCTVIPGTCVGQPAGAYESPVWDFCEKVSGQDPDTLATGLGVEGVNTGDVAVGDSGVTASPLPLGTNSSSTTGSVPAKKKKSFVDRNLGWIIGTIVGAILLIFFIFTVRYLFCTKPQEEQMHTKGLLVPSSPSSKGSAAPSSPSGSIPSHSPDGKYADAVITAAPKYSSKNGLSFADGDKNGKADIGHDAKIITVSSIDDELEEEKKMSKKGDSAFDMLVKRAAEIRAKKKDEGSLARQEKRGKKVSDGERKMRKGGKAVVAAADTEEALEGVGGSDESPTGTKLEGNNYATKSYNKARAGGKPAGTAPTGKAPLDWQIGMTPKRSAKLEPAETATDLRSSVAGVLHRLTGIGKKSEDNTSPTTPSPTATRPIQEPWEVYARGGTNTNTSTNNTSLQTRWSAVPSSEKDLLTDAPLSTEPAADVTPGQSADVTTSQVSSRSSMLQSLLWLPKGKSWGMDFLQWRVPEAMNKNGSGDNVLKLGTIQSQDAMRVSTLPSAKPNRISVSLDDMNDSPAGTPAGMPPKSGGGFAKLRGSSGSSEGGSARSVLDPARRRLLGLGAPVSPAAGEATEDMVAGKDKETTVDEAPPLAKSTTSFWNLWGGATGDKPATGAEATQDVVPKAGLQMAGLYPDAAGVRPAEGSFDGGLPLRKSDVQGVVKQALRASQLERSNSSGSSAATHFELSKSQGVESPMVEVAPAQVQWPAPGLQGADAAAHEKRVDSQLLAKLLESESSSAATPVTIGHMVASPSSSREGLSPGALAAARTAAASPKFPFSVPTASMWRATPASKPAPAPVTSLKPSSMPALTANNPSSLSPSQPPVSIHSGPQISSPAAKTSASPLPALAALPAATALNPSSGTSSGNPTTPRRPSPQLGRPDWSASWAAASLNSRVGPPAPGAPDSPATSLSISMGNNSFKERILAEASSPRSPSMRDISAVKALMASTASSTGSLGFSPLRERIMAAAAVEPGAAGEQPTSIYARNTSQSKAASTAGQSSWSRVKSTGAPAVASARPQAAAQEPNAAIITVGDNVPE